MQRWVFLGFALVALIIVMIGLPIVQEGTSTANATIADYTANTTTWQGLPEVFQVSPWLLLIMFFISVPVLWWKIGRKGR